MEILKIKRSDIDTCKMVSYNDFIVDMSKMSVPKGEGM